MRILSNRWQSLASMLSIMLSLSLTFASCGGDDNKIIPEKPEKEVLLEVKTTLPDGVSDFEVKSLELTFENISSGAKKSFSSLEGLKVAPGIYNINYLAEGRYKMASNPLVGKLVARLSEHQILASDKPYEITLDLRIVPVHEDFLIEEIFFTGVTTPADKPYNGTNYISLYNATDRTLYADGIAFCETEFNSAIKWDYQPDIRHEAVAVQAVYVVPGSGTDHPVAPGERFILCDVGIDHKTHNPNAFDLSKANFEWYDEFSSPKHQDIDSPFVPNLDKWYCYTRSFFILHNRGFHSYIIARTETDKETFLKDYIYEYKYKFVHKDNERIINRKTYKIPLSWVIDGVNCSVQAAYKWNILPEEVDAGWTHCGTVDQQKDRFFHSVRRKYLGKDANGNKILQDTNNSTADFNPMVTPSLIEEQGAATDTQGTPATTKTYDGVTPREEA